MVITQTGAGVITRTNTNIRLHVPAAYRAVYSNAQIASYQRRIDFDLTPPLRMTVKAWSEGILHGTAGFGLWNHPFAPGERGVRLPKAAWFFHSTPPSQIALAKDVPSSGWKAATFDATRWQFFALLPTAPLGMLLMRIPAVYDMLWGIGQRAIGVSETLLDRELLREAHVYRLEWQHNQITFWVDDRQVLETDLSPNGTLGFIAWVDNQYAVVTPQGKIGFGLVDAPHAQSLILEQILLEKI
jgi:hypothetical protein